MQICTISWWFFNMKCFRFLTDFSFKNFAFLFPFPIGATRKGLKGLQIVQIWTISWWFFYMKYFRFLTDFFFNKLRKISTYLDRSKIISQNIAIAFAIAFNKLRVKKISQSHRNRNRHRCKLFMGNCFHGYLFLSKISFYVSSSMGGIPQGNPPKNL